MRPAVLVLFLAACIARPLAADNETLHGFVVGIPSPTSVAFDDFSATTDNRLSLEIASSPAGPNAVHPGQLRVGDEIEIRGKFNSATHQLSVRSVRVLSDDARKISSSAFSDKPVDLQKTTGGWNGYLFLEGMQVRVADSTTVNRRNSERDLKQVRAQESYGVPPRISPLRSLEGLGPETMARFDAATQKDGSLLASKVEFENFELTANESEHLKKLEPRIQKGDALVAQPDELRIGRNKYKLVPSPQAQEYVQRLGECLVPQRQRELPANSSLKINYRFYLVQDKDFNVIAFPSGAIVVNSGLLDGLENEAQLAFQISRAMTQVEEMDTWRLSRYYSSPGHRTLEAVAIGAELAPFFLMNVPTLIVASKSEGFVDSLRDQADLLALEWMLAAGYDVREAPRAYKAYALTHPDHKPLYPRPDANQVEKNEWAAARRVFLMTQLRTSYSGVDYEKLKKDTEQFHAVRKQILPAAR